MVRKYSCFLFALLWLAILIPQITLVASGGLKRKVIQKPIKTPTSVSIKNFFTSFPGSFFHPEESNAVRSPQPVTEQEQKEAKEQEQKEAKEQEQKKAKEQEEKLAREQEERWNFSHPQMTREEVIAAAPKRQFLGWGWPLNPSQSQLLQKKPLLRQKGLEDVPSPALLAPRIPAVPAASLVPSISAPAALPVAGPVLDVPRAVASPAPSAPPAPPAPPAPSAPGVLKPVGPGKSPKGRRRQLLSEELKLNAEQEDISDKILLRELVLLSGEPKEGPGKIPQEGPERARVLGQYFSKYIKTGFDHVLDESDFVYIVELEKIKKTDWDVLTKNIERIVNQETAAGKTYELFEELVIKGVHLFKPLFFNWQKYGDQVVDCIRLILLHTVCLSRVDQAQDHYQENDSDLLVVSVLLDAQSHSMLVQNMNELILDINFKKYRNLFKLPSKDVAEEAANRYNVMKTFFDGDLLEKKGVSGYVDLLFDVIEKELMFSQFGVEEKDQIVTKLITLFTDYKEESAALFGQDKIIKSALSYDELFKKYCIPVKNIRELVTALEHRVKKEATDTVENRKKLEALIHTLKQEPENEAAVMTLFEQLFVATQNSDFIASLYKMYSVNIKVFSFLKEIMKTVRKMVEKIRDLKPEEVKNVLESSYQGHNLYDIMPDRKSGSFAVISKEFKDLKRDPRKLFALYKKFYLDQIASVDALNKVGITAENFIYMLAPYGVLLSIIDDFNQTKVYKHLVNDLTVLNTGIRKSDDISKEGVSEQQSNLSKLLRVRSGTLATDILELGLYKDFLNPVIAAVEKYDIRAFKEEVDKLVSIAKMGVENTREYTDLLNKAETLILDQGYIDSIQKLKQFTFDIDIKTGASTGIGARQALSIKGAIQRKMKSNLSPLIMYLENHVLRKVADGALKKQIQFHDLYPILLQGIVPQLIVSIREGFEHLHVIVTDKMVYELVESMISQLESKIIAVLSNIYNQANNRQEKEAEEEYELFKEELARILRIDSAVKAPRALISVDDKEKVEKRYHTAQELIRILYNQENMSGALRKNLRRIFEQYEKSDTYQDNSLWVQEHLDADYRSASDIMHRIFVYLINDNIPTALELVSKAFGGSRAIGIDFTYAAFMQKEESGLESRWNQLLEQMVQDNKFKFLEDGVSEDLIKKDQELIAARKEKERIAREQKERERREREQKEQEERDAQEKEARNEELEKVRQKEVRKKSRESAREKRRNPEPEQVASVLDKDVRENLELGHTTIFGLIERGRKEKNFPQQLLQKFEILLEKLEKLLKNNKSTEKERADIATEVNELVGEYEIWKRKQKIELLDD